MAGRAVVFEFRLVHRGSRHRVRVGSRDGVSDLRPIEGFDNKFPWETHREAIAATVLRKQDSEFQLRGMALVDTKQDA